MDTAIDPYFFTRESALEPLKVVVEVERFLYIILSHPPEFLDESVEDSCGLSVSLSVIEILNEFSQVLTAEELLLLENSAKIFFMTAVVAVEESEEHTDWCESWDYNWLGLWVEESILHECIETSP